jgi:Mrp family chromosome partitioning ATPase
MSENTTPVPADEALWNEQSEPSKQHNPLTWLTTALRGRWFWAIGLAILLGGGAAAAGFFLVPDKYESVGKLRVQPKEDQLIYRTADKDVPYMYEAWLQTQMNRVTAPTVVRKAMNSETWQQAVQAVDNPPTRKEFTKAIETKPQNAYEVELSFESRHEALAKPGTDAVLEAFVSYYRAQGSDKEDRYLRLLEDRKADLQSKLDQLERRKSNYTGQLDTEALRQQYQFVQQQVQQYERELNDIEMSLAAVDGSDKKLTDMSVPQLASVDPRMRRLFEQKEQLERQIDMRTGPLGYGSQHQSVVELEARLQELKAEIQRYAEQVRRGQISPSVDNDRGRQRPVAQLRQRKEQLIEQKKQAKARLLDLGQRVRKIRKIDEQVEQIQTRLDETTAAIEKRQVENQVRDRMKIAGFGSSAQPANVSARRKMAVMGGVGGSAVGFGLIVMIGLLSPRIRHAGEAQGGWPAMRMLGVLPTLPHKLTDPEQAESAALSVHHIRTLLQLGPTDRSRVYTVTSPAAGSGKTSLSIALGLSFAASHTRTLVIDCDLVGAGLTRRLNAEKVASLASWLRMTETLSEDQLDAAQTIADQQNQALEDVLVDHGYLSIEQLETLQQQRESARIGIMEAANGLPLKECVTSLNGDGLHVLPVGSAPEHDAGSLSPAALHRVVEAARDQYEVVLIDTGPVLGSLEASMTAVESDGVVFIVSRGDQKSLSFRSLDALQSIGAPLAGIVFNHADDDDMLRSSYTAGSVSRRGSPRRHRPLVPRDHTRRYGPLASAVVACGSQADERDTSANNGSP